MGRILSLTIIYKIVNIERFETVQQLASYSRLVKCKALSAEKPHGNKIGNAHFKWAFSETAVLDLRDNKKARRYLDDFQNRMRKAKSLSGFAQKLGRCIYFMLNNETMFYEDKFR